ncbi:cutinase family protein [Leucobacter sp. CSA2]|uniref:Cutinase family protein n=1 Tax=Leucobacter edaphi TaxID=2796472 RepID=A0A934QDR4_9MICO|nr:cutinase family protein [Leucobacter edaphi]MBK0421359.1 cutinase family protein [Leucobacter edaphi]
MSLSPHQQDDTRNRSRAQRSNRGRLRALAAGLVLPALLLAGCATQPDPEETRSSLKEVTDNPTTPDAAEQYDAAKHPDPVVEPIECSSELVVTVRGTAEKSRNQLLTPVAKTVTKALNSSQTIDLDYPADTDVKLGGTAGVRTLIDMLNVQSDACPDQRFVLLGYSQGAFVIGDALSDPEARLVGERAGTVDPLAADRVVAIVLYGNPRFEGTESYGAGDYASTLNGILPRPVGALARFADRIRDFCVEGDFVCQSTTTIDEKAHVAYYSNGMQDQGAEYVLDRFRETDPGALKRSALRSTTEYATPPKPAN